MENSGCVGMCVNMCKIPAQDFFTNEFGLPLTMNPNFEDMSCEMVYGQPPPPYEQDPVANNLVLLTYAPWRNLVPVSAISYKA
nr:beta-carotene isomerase D27, chloroplastic [Ipomoea batatas]